MRHVCRSTLRSLQVFPVAWDTSWIFLALVLAVCWQYLHVNPIVAKDDRAAPFMTAAGARELWDGIQVHEGMAQDAAAQRVHFKRLTLSTQQDLSALGVQF